MAKVKDVTPSNAYAMLKRGAVLVDVRQPREIARISFDIPDVIEIPLSRFEQRMQEIPAKRKVIVACRRGNRSMYAARLLLNNGHQRVFNLEQGIIRWEKERLPVKSAPKQNLLSTLMSLFSKKS
ncbi:MAG: sulfurtransferase [Prosthecochloris sp.]|nr:sulfurtransferase [Prosthecochloris sp.]